MRLDFDTHYMSLAKFSDDNVIEYVQRLNDCTLREFEMRVMLLEHPKDLSMLLRHAVTIFDSAYRVTRLHMHYGRSIVKFERESVLFGVWYDDDERFNGKMRF